jgi:hypothetical protein
MKSGRFDEKEWIMDYMDYMDYGLFFFFLVKCILFKGILNIYVFIFSLSSSNITVF